MGKIKREKFLQKGLALVRQLTLGVFSFVLGIQAIAYSQSKPYPQSFNLILQESNKAIFPIQFEKTSDPRIAFRFDHGKSIPTSDIEISKERFGKFQLDDPWATRTMTGLPFYSRIPSPDQAEPSRPVETHKFWDGTNLALFAGVGIVRTLDYTSTQWFRKRGIDEALLTNEIVDNKPLFASIEAGGTAASIGISYLFHRSGHHKLERWMSIAHIGVGIGGAIWNYSFCRRNPTDWACQ